MAQGCQIWSGLITQLPEEYLNKKIKTRKEPFWEIKNQQSIYNQYGNTTLFFFKRHFFENWCCKAPSDNPALA